MRVKVTKEAIEQLMAKGVSINRLNILIEGIADLLVQKNADYSNAWQRWGIFTPLIRLNDKLLRLKQGASGEVYLVADECIRDTLRDLLGYSVLALLWLDANEDISALVNDLLVDFDNLPKDGFDDDVSN